MENQKWYDCGNEALTAASEFLNFEKSFKPELDRKIREYDRLENEAEKLSAKLTAATADLNQKTIFILSQLRESADKIRASLQAKAETSDIELEIADKLESKAKAGAETIQSLGYDALKIELALAEIQVAKFQVAEEPFQLRRQAARKFFLNLIQGAGIGIYFQTGDSCFGQTTSWNDKLQELETRIGIMKGQAKSFRPIDFVTNSADGVLGMAAMLPKESLSGLIEAWCFAVGEKARKIKLTYDRSGSLKYYITRQKPETRDLLTTHDMGFDVASASDRPRYSTARQRAKD